MITGEEFSWFRNVQNNFIKHVKNKVGFTACRGTIVPQQAVKRTLGTLTLIYFNNN
jgi:hypothetical protein